MSKRSRTGAAGALAAVVALAATGCGGSGSAQSSSTPTSEQSSAAAQLSYTAPARTSKTVSSVTWDLPNGEPTTVDPVKAGDYGPDMIASNLCDDLFRLTPNWGYEPELAQSYLYKNNRKTLVLNIRHGVKFWNGKTLTAADVAYSLKRNMDPSTGAVSGGFFQHVSSIDQTGQYTVTVNFKTQDELFIKELATVVGAVVDRAYVQKVGDKAFGTARGGVMCSGPYELSGWSAGTQMVLTANPHYWDKSLQPHVKKVTVKFISNSSTLTSALESGEIQGAYEVPAVAIPALKSVSSGKLYLGHSLQVQELIPASKTGPMANVKVRRALSMVLDRSAIAQKVYYGAASPNLALTPSESWAPVSSRSIYAAGYSKLGSGNSSIADAKTLVDSVPDHAQTITLATLAGDQTQDSLATLVQQYASEIGLNMKVAQEQPLNFSNLFYIPSYRKGVDLVLSSGFLDIPDQLDYLAYWIDPGSIFNWTGYNDPTTVRLANQAQATFNANQRANLLVQAQDRYMGNYQLVVPVEEADEVSFLGRGLAGITTSFAYVFEPSFAYLGTS